MDNHPKTVVITGTSSGFGEGAAKRFAGKGYRVWGTMRDISGRNAAKKSALEAHSDLISIVEMDVTNQASVTAAFEHIQKANSIDILVNNAGVMDVGLTEGYSVDQAHALMETNYYGAIRVMQAVLPAMRHAKSGLIINTSSLVGRVTAPFFGTYAATKHALEAYSQSLRYELSAFGVDVAIVEPGPFGTNLINVGQAPSRHNIVESYGELKNVPIALLDGFAQMLAGPDAPNPELVVDAYLELAELPQGQRPTRKIAGLTWGVDELNQVAQPIQDNILNTMQLNEVLGGKSA